MTVEKFIRTLGYIVYVILWAPLLALIIPGVTIAYMVMLMRLGFTFKETCNAYAQAMKNSIRHDMEFIRTGVWY